MFSHRPPFTGFAGAHLLLPSQGPYSFLILSHSPLSISLLSLSFPDPGQNSLQALLSIIGEALFSVKSAIGPLQEGPV